MTINLCQPMVVGPVSELSRSIRVIGQLSGATVTLWSIASLPRPLGSVVASSGEAFVELNANESLATGDLLVAAQSLGTDISPPVSVDSPFSILVQPAPKSANDLHAIAYVSNLWRCGQHLWLEGGIPGAQAVAEQNGQVLGTGVFLDAEGARFDLSPALTGLALSCRQIAGAPVGFSGPPSSRLPIDIPGGGGGSLPAPNVDPDTAACQTSVSISGVFDGADVVLVRSNGVKSVTYREGFDLDVLWFTLDTALSAGETLTVHQEVGKLCDRPGLEDLKTVKPHQPLTPPQILNSICVGSLAVHVSGLQPGAPVRLTNGTRVWFAQAPNTSDNLDVIVDSLVSGILTVEQWVCGDWDIAGSATVSAGDDNAIPSLIISPNPLTACSPVISVTGVKPGAYLIASSRALGYISGWVAATGTDAVIHVAPLLIEGDLITVTEMVCGVDAASTSALVGKATDLAPPEIVAPVFVGQTTVTVAAVVPGARVQLFVYVGSVLKRVVAAPPALTTKVEIVLAMPLDEGDSVQARQALCDRLSGMSEPVAATLQLITDDWWTWDGADPQEESWNRTYTVSGRLTNKGDSPLYNVHFTYWIDASNPGDITPGMINSGASTPGAFPKETQTWPWIVPGVWIPKETIKSFNYRVDVDATDLTGTQYPRMSAQKTVTVQVSTVKIAAAGTAAAASQVALYLAIVAAAAAASVWGLVTAWAWAVAAVIAAAVAAGASALALDPPAPDANFRLRVPIPARSVESAADAQLGALLDFLSTAKHIFALTEASYRMESLRLGAIVAVDTGWEAVHLIDRDEAVKRQIEAARTLGGLARKAAVSLSGFERQFARSALVAFGGDILLTGVPLRARWLLRIPEIGGILNQFSITKNSVPDLDAVASIMVLYKAVVDYVNTADQDIGRKRNTVS